MVSNATRWDTFEGLIGESRLPESERLFRQRYVKVGAANSWLQAVGLGQGLQSGVDRARAAHAF